MTTTTTTTTQTVDYDALAAQVGALMGNWPQIQHKLYMAGFNAYSDGEPLGDGHCQEYERGWYDAWNADTQQQVDEAQSEFTDWRQ